MTQYIDKDALVEEINKRIIDAPINNIGDFLNEQLNNLSKDYIMDTETLKKLHRIYDQTNSFGKELMEKEFPELKESEDEKIRKEIIRIVKIWTNSVPTVNGIPVETLLAWLEKQGELVNSLSKGLDNAHERIDGLIQKNNSLIEQLEKQGEQNWSEEDEENFNMLSKIICDSQASAKIANKLSDWLESLKERVK